MHQKRPNDPLQIDPNSKVHKENLQVVMVMIKGKSKSKVDPAIFRMAEIEIINMDDIDIKATKDSLLSQLEEAKTVVK